MSTDPNTPDTSQTPTITHWQQLASSHIELLNTMASQIPGVEEQHPSTAKFVHGHQSIPDAFIASAVAALEQVPSLQGVDGLDSVTSRSDQQFVDAFTQLADKLLAVHKAIRFTVQTKRANLAAAALQTYYLAKGIARNRTNAAAISHVANMKRDLGKRGRRPAKGSDPQQPSPTTPEVPEPHGNAAQG